MSSLQFGTHAQGARRSRASQSGTNPDSQQQPQSVDEVWEAVQQASRRQTQSSNDEVDQSGQPLQRHSSSFAADDSIGQLARGLSRLNMSRQKSADERDDSHALSLTAAASSDAIGDPRVPDSYFGEGNAEGGGVVSSCLSQ